MSRIRHYKDFGPEILGPLNEELDDIMHRIRALEQAPSQVISGITVGTTTTEVRHQLGMKPRMIHPVARGAIAVGQPQPATETSIYLVAASSVVVDVYLEG